MFTHGHVDHVFGMAPYDQEAAAKGWQAPVVVAHEAVAARFERYARTAGYNAVINRRQFGLDELEWPADYRYPDRVYRDRDSFSCGGLTFELRHAISNREIFRRHRLSLSRNHFASEGSEPSRFAGRGAKGCLRPSHR